MEGKEGRREEKGVREGRSRTQKEGREGGSGEGGRKGSREEGRKQPVTVN